MNFDELIRRRQSVRKYLPGAVPREMIEACIHAASLAPSACNSQPWSFIVVDDPSLKNRLVAESCSGPYRMNAFAAEASVMVVLLTQRSKLSATLGGMFRGLPYRLIDIGYASDHFCLKAAELGLGTCILGWFHERRVKKILKLPWGAHVDLMISLGWPADPEIRPKNRKSPAEILRYNLS